MAVNINPGTLIILSGVPGSGKSTLVSKWPNEISRSVISTDTIRSTLFGIDRSIVDGQLASRPRSSRDNEVFQLAEELIGKRLSQGLTTVIDATSTTDKDRRKWVEIADRYGREHIVLILNTPESEILKGNLSRENKVAEDVVRRFINKLSLSSKYNHRVIHRNTSINFIARSIEEHNLDLIGDIHGCLDKALDLIKSLGYSINTDGIPKHLDASRRLLFMGDFIDRGEQSLDAAVFVMKCVKAGHFAIKGNHETNLVKYFDGLKKGDTRFRSRATAKTLADLLRLKARDQENLINFLRKLPVNYTHKDIFICHGSPTYVNPIDILESTCIYGDKNYGGDSNDEIYNALWEKGVNKNILIRAGHPIKGKDLNGAFSMEAKVAENGDILGMPLDKFMNDRINKANVEAFSSNLVKVTSSFDYRNNRTPNWDLLNEINDLLNKRLIREVRNADGMILYKYCRDVLFKNLWDKTPNLRLMRGLVLDFGGNIIQNPFRRTNNFGEHGAGAKIKDDDKYVWVEKMNGFLGVITKHPHNNSLLTTTTGSFDSDFVGYIRDSIPKESIGKCMKFFNKCDLTLMFEVIHPADPHIIEYNEEDMGLWLIGAKGKDLNSKQLPEEDLDIIASEIGVKRPKWGISKFKEIKEMTARCKHEGYMVRAEGDSDHIVKMKSPYYLGVKFISRQGKSKINMMFKNTEVFKSNVDEEFYEVVDFLADTYKNRQEEFSRMSDEEIRQVIRKHEMSVLIQGNKDLVVNRK